MWGKKAFAGGGRGGPPFVIWYPKKEKKKGENTVITKGGFLETSKYRGEKGNAFCKKKRSVNIWGVQITPGGGCFFWG